MRASSGVSGSSGKRSVPEGSQHRHPAGVVPRAGGDNAAGADDSPHLGDTRIRVGHEVHDELRERRIERVGRPRQRLRTADLNVRTGNTLCVGCDKGLGRVDDGDLLRPDQLSERFGQRARPAADVEHAVAPLNARECEQAWREQVRVASHEHVVGFTAGLEGHGVRSLSS